MSDECAKKPKTRLETISELVMRCNVVADIGADHGKLCAMLLKSGRCKKAIACDISAPSLEKAKKLAKRLGEVNLETRLGDGLAPLERGEADGIIIAGMGGETICGILREGLSIAKSAEFWVLAPNSRQGELRAFLRGNGFWADDYLAFEKGRYYQIILVRPGMDAQKTPNDWPQGFDELGFTLLKKRHSLLVPYVTARLWRLRERRAAAKAAPALDARIEALECVLTLANKEGLT